MTEPIDIGELGNIINELLGNDELFDNYSKPAKQISHMVGMFGEKQAIPESIWDVCC